ncbi:MAG: TIGR03545 family protein [Nitrospirota bacterium]
MKWIGAVRIRWPGLIAFVAVVGLGLAIWFLVIDGLVERAIEAAGSKLVGAKVELDHADVSLIPLGIELKRLQVTNPDQPMRNAVEITRMAFGMEALQLLRRKVIIDEMAIDGMQFNTQRQTSGAIVRREEKKEESKEGEDSFFAMPSLDLPSAKDILAKEDLESLKLVETVRGEIDAGRERWKQRVAQVSDKAKLDEYRRRADEIRKSAKGGAEALLGNVAEAAQLRKDVMADLDQVKGAREDLSKDLAAFKRRIDEVAAAPQADLKRLREKYSLTAGGMGNVAAALFGGNIGYWAKTSAAWYERLQPALASAGKTGGPEQVKPLRGKGIDVKFRERQPLPDFLIRTARVTAEIPAGTLKGEVLRITPDQDILGAPTTFEFAGDKLQQLRTVALRGEINRVRPDQPRDTVTLNADGYGIQRAVLSDNPKWPVVLDGAKADLDLKAVIASGALDATIDSRLSGVHFSTGEHKPEGRVAEAIASALADVQAFHLGATVTGTTRNPDVKVTSDLDAVLKNAVGKMVSEQAARLEADLKAAIAEKVNGPLEDLKKQLAGYGELGQALASRSDALNKLLSEQLAPKIKGLKLPF